MLRWGVFLLCSVLVGVAQAAPKAKKQAEELHKQGESAYYQKKDYLEALRLYQEAYRLWPKAWVLLNLAQCYRALNSYQKALDAFQQALPEIRDQKEREEIIEVIQELQEKVKPIEVTEGTTEAPSFLPPFPEPERVLPALSLPLVLRPVEPEASFSVGRALYRSAAVSLGVGVLSGVAALAFGRQLQEGIASSEEDLSGLRTGLRVSSVVSDVSFGGAAVLGALGYRLLPSERAEHALQGALLLSSSLAISCALLSLQRAIYLGELRSTPDPDPLVLRQMQTQQAVYSRGAFVSVSVAFASASGLFLTRRLYKK